MFIPSMRACVYVAAMAVGLYLLKSYIRGAAYTGSERMDGKVVLITGANSGIGKETARELAARGAHVIMACRDLARCDHARNEIHATTGKSAQCMEMDLSSFRSIRAFAKEFNSKFDRLDVLINNAGVMMTPKLQTSDGLELQSGVNHFGHFLLTKLVLDKVKAASPSRIIVVSSRAHLRGEINLTSIVNSDDYGPMSSYSQSKLANVMFSNELARRLGDTGVTVNSLHPGVIDTDLTRYIPVINNPVFDKLIFKPLKYFLCKTPIEGAQTTLRLALDPTLAHVTGKYFSDCQQVEPAPQALDEHVARELWELSEDVTGTVTS